MSAPMPGGPIQYPHGYDKPVASLAQFILDTIVATYAEAGVDLPPRQLVAIGTVSVDEPVLAVMFGGISTGEPGNEANSPVRADRPRTASFSIELWRTTPGLNAAGMPPSADSVSAAAMRMMDDSWLIMEAVSRADQLGVGVIASAAANDPQGGTVGVSCSLDIQIP